MVSVSANNPWFYSQAFQDELEAYSLGHLACENPEDLHPIDPPLYPTPSPSMSPCDTPSSGSDIDLSSCSTSPHYSDHLLNFENPFETAVNFVPIEINVEPCMSEREEYRQEEVKAPKMEIDFCEQGGELQTLVLKDKKCVAKPPVGDKSATVQKILSGRVSRRGRRPKQVACSAKAQASKDWREKQKREQDELVAHVVEVERQNEQLTDDNRNLKNQLTAKDIEITRLMRQLRELKRPKPSC